MEWPTDQAVFDELDNEFHFRLDAFATKENAKCSEYFTVQDNALAHPWKGPVFMNPPYGPLLKQCVRKAWEEWRRGALVVALLPARVDTKWFHAYCISSAEIRFIAGRIRYAGAKWNAPFPSMVVVWRPLA